ncbi:MAG: glutathione S-transferase family protein [Hyphomicrobiaceae bacterium]|nr:glutathione S-transferase family protein [Hyphomicrobiaceae bacterium]MCC0008303.1 glutathione S-transferase family protein [Hyphomicrobiaceae bacterium]
MHKLTHFRLCPHSRSIRILLTELGIGFSFTEERPWEYRQELLAMNPAGELPVLQLQGGTVLCGSYAISEYLAEDQPVAARDRYPLPIFPGSRTDRAEARRLVDWFHGKLNREVTREILEERVYRAYRQSADGAPDAAILRAIRANVRYHMSYIAYLADQRSWLAGDEMSFADIAAAAHLSCLDYLGEVPWDDYEPARIWYMRMKSRPAFRPLLADRISGVAAPRHYADLDF